MPKFESSLTNKQINQPMREINIPDESGFVPNIPSQQTVMNRQAPPVIDERTLMEFQSRLQAPLPQMREMSDVEQQILNAKKAKREGKERLSEGARRRIELLIGMTRLSKTMEIDGQTYKLQTLTSQELREAMVAAAEFDGSIQFIFETRKQLLARSLVIVAGVEITQFLNSDNLEDKLTFIELIDHALLDRLYNEYSALIQEAKDKYSPKSEAEVKEVIEDLKK